jgi:hypothetical protein
VSFIIVVGICTALYSDKFVPTSAQTAEEVKLKALVTFQADTEMSGASVFVAFCRLASCSSFIISCFAGVLVMNPVPTVAIIICAVTITDTMKRSFWWAS